MVPTSGLNHLTLRISDLDRAISFFCGLLGFSLRHCATADAYLTCGSLWLALLERRPDPHRAPYV